MSETSKEFRQKRFGTMAISKGFITLEQFIRAIKIQAEEELKQQTPRLIGQILIDLGFMNVSQVNEVLDELLKEAYLSKCSDKGVMIFKCPNCGTELRRSTHE